MVIIGDFPENILQIKNLWQSLCLFRLFIYLRTLSVTLLRVSFCFKQWSMSLTKTETVCYNIAPIIRENYLGHEWEYT